jgi:hypothetical protein
VSGGYRRGFKKECEEICLEVRAELGLGRFAAFDPFALADHLLIPHEPIGDYAGDDRCGWAVAHLAAEGRDEFSAATVYRGTQRRILYNGQHSPARRWSDVAHELSHVLLEHEPGPVRGNGDARTWNPDQEREASWLSGVLLVPEHVALRLARLETPITAAATSYGVSVQLMQFRLNASGALKRVRRERAARGR